MGVLFKRGSIDPMRMKKVNGSEGDSIVCEYKKIILLEIVAKYNKI